MENRVADALSRRPNLLTIFSVNISGFAALKELYLMDPDFRTIWLELQQNPPHSMSTYAIKDGFLTKDSRICVPVGSMRAFIINELHSGGLAGHFGFDKTLALTSDRFYWPRLRRDVHKIVAQCRTC